MEKQTIKQLPKVDRPREKLISKGVANLKDAELLAILLNTGVAGENVLQVALRILKQYPKRDFLKLSFKELSSIKGVGQVKACLLLASCEFIKRALEVKEEIAPIIKTVEDVVAQSIYMKDKQREHFMVLYLNARNELIFKKPMFVGTLNANIVHPREIFGEAIKQNAAFVIFCHNHPSGNEQPSQADLEINKRLVEAGKIMGIEALDHIIITKTRVFSFKESGLM
ncbi:MAG: DNA repair protein RadC [Candidatus Gribaldobacteria bacterium]|nr:DNA repair protein RadC [Candidatus Gribaldobacteria bacterium]